MQPNFTNFVQDVLVLGTRGLGTIKKYAISEDIIKNCDFSIEKSKILTFFFLGWC